MKYYLGLFIILFPVLAIGQTKTHVDSLAEIVLRDLMDSWTLGIDGNAEAVDIKTYNKFKNLFDLNATIDDDLNAFYQHGNKKSGSYRIDNNPKPFDVYAHDVALQIKSMLIDNDNVVRIESNTTDQKNMTFTIKRDVDFQKPRKYVLRDTYISHVLSNPAIEFKDKKDKKDSLAMASNFKAIIDRTQDSIYKFTSKETLRITMAYEADTVKITGIRNIINEVRCTNDSDLDAVLDREDSLPGTPGDFTANGRPDDDLDGVPNKDDKCPETYGDSKNKGCPLSYFYTKNGFDVFIGLQFNSAKINLPGLNQLGYTDASGKDAIDVLQSKKGVLKNPGKPPGGVYAGGNFAYYFGQKRKQSGISVGFTYSTFTAEYQLTEPIIYTFKSSDGINFYRRQITINSLKEGINYNVLNFPVMFNYRLYLDTKDRSVIKLRIGPSLMFFNATSSYNAVIDFGGLYQIDTIKKNAITYYDYFDRGSKYNVFLTSDSINAQNSSPGAGNVFQQLGSKNYDFANNKNYNGKSNNLKRLSVAFNVDLEVQHKLSEGLTIEAGAHLVYAPLWERKEKYKPIDKTSDEFQSIYNSNAKSSYSSLGVNVGFVYNW